VPLPVPQTLPVGIRVMIVVHVFSGLRRAGDFEDWVGRLAHEAGIRCLCMSFDYAANPSHDLLDDDFFGSLRALCWSGLVWGFLGGPPCKTWSKLRWIPNGPPPLRHRSRPFGMAGLQGKSKAACDHDSELFLRHLDLKTGVVTMGGRGVTEHPSDPKVKPFPSVFATPQMRAFATAHGAQHITLDQCMYGAPTRKRTDVMAVLEGIEGLATKCTHRRHARPCGGVRPDGGFFSTGTEVYPSHLCRALAQLVVDSFLEHGLGRSPGEAVVPPPWAGLRGVTPTGRARHAPVPPAHEVWPLREAPRFLAEARRAVDAAALRGRGCSL